MPKIIERKTFTRIALTSAVLVDPMVHSAASQSGKDTRLLSVTCLLTHFVRDGLQC